MTTHEQDVLPIEDLWSRFTQRLMDDPDLRVEMFASEYPDHAEEVCRVFPLMLELDAFGSDIADVLEEELTPDYIGRYRIVRRIGRGGMGVVYEAERDTLQQRVAMKVISPDRLDAKSVQRFESEARTIATLHHSHVVPIHDFGEHDGECYFTMRLVDGPNLADVIRTSEVADEDQSDTENSIELQRLLNKIQGNWTFIARLGEQAASALAHAHEHGVLHRDIKPANLLVDGDDKLWVTDFGLAKQKFQSLSVTSIAHIVGTPRYMAPEQLRGMCDERSDIFSLGVTLYELALLGSVTTADRDALWKGELEPIQTVNPRVPERLADIINKATSHRIAERYSSAGELTADLAAFRNDAEAPEVRRTSWFLAIVGATAAMLCLAIGSLAMVAPRAWTANVGDGTGAATTELVRAVSRTGGNTSTNMVFDQEFGVTEGSVEIGRLDGDAASWQDARLSGPDADLLRLDRETGELQFVTAPDFEVPNDHDMNNAYEIEVARAGAFERSPPLRLRIDVGNVNEAPSFDEFVFESDGKTILRSDREVSRAWMLDVHDDTDAIYDGLLLTISGGDDRDLVTMTPQGVFVLDRRIQSTTPIDADRDGVYEFEVTATDESQPWMARLAEDDDGTLSLVKEQVVAGARLRMTLALNDCLVRRDVIDIASADGRTFYHIHRDDDGTTALFRSRLDASQGFVSQLLHDDCGIEQRAIGFSTLDGKTFHYLLRTRGHRQATQLWTATLQGDGRFTSTMVSESSGLSYKLQGLSHLDTNRFHHVRLEATGDATLRFSFLGRQRFTNMRLHATQSQYLGKTRGQAAWIQRGPNSKSTTKQVRVKVTSE